MRIFIAVFVFLGLCAGIADAELSLPSGYQCAEGTYGGFCMGIDHARWGMVSPMVRLFRREYNLINGVGSKSEIVSFSMTETLSSYHTTNLCICPFDLTNDLLVQAGCEGYCPSDQSCGRGWNYTYGAYAIPTTLHNGTYLCHASARAKFRMEQNGELQEVEEPPLDTDDAWGWIDVSNLTISSTAINVLIWNGTAPIGIPYSISDGGSVGLTNVELFVYPMGPGAPGAPIYHQTTAATVPAGSATSYYGTITLDSQTPGWNAPPGLYVYDIKVSHQQGFYFPPSPDDPPVWPDWKDKSQADIDNNCANWAQITGTGDITDSDSRWDKADSLHSPLTVTVDSCTGPTRGSGGSYTFEVHYTLSRAASYCTVTLYGPGLTPVWSTNSQTLSTLKAIGSHDVSHALTAPAPGDYWFVVSARDSERCNKGHQYKVATDRGMMCTLSSAGNGLPSSNLNSAAGANRSNIKWANSNPDIGYGDDFKLPSGQWVIDKIRVWAIPTVPGYESYTLGDHFSSVTLYKIDSSGALSAVQSGNFTSGNATNNPSISITAVTYPIPDPIMDPTGGLYERATGELDKIFQIDFANLNWQVTGGMPCFFGVHGVSRIDRLWFNAASNPALSGWESEDSDGHLRSFDVSHPENGATLVNPAGWFGGKGSDINVQVFAHPL